MSKRKIVLIGAGSASFTVGLVADLLISDIADEWEVGLVDIDERALGVARGLVEKMVQQREAHVSLQADTDRCAVLSGADVVVTTIAVGGRRAWENDVLIPRRHGIFQPVGDTVSAGGISRAMRQIPPMLDIARDVHRLCPEAYFFNYGNPMAAICRAVNKATPARLTGLCHGVQGTLRHLCSLIEVPYSEIGALYCGMNHLTWITHFTHHGENLWPRVDTEIAANPPQDNPFSWELYRTYGAFPAVLDRHVSEFFSERFAGGDYYGRKLGVDAFDIISCIKSGDERYEKMAAQAEGREPLEARLFQRTLGEHEALIPILESMFADRQQLFPMNVPNRTVPGIPEGFVLEMPTAATRAGCLPLAMPPLPPALRAIVVEALYGVEITVEAALTGDRQTFVQALLYDRCVNELGAAEALADDLLKAQEEYLPQF